eukprot:543390_1
MLLMTMNSKHFQFVPQIYQCINYTIDNVTKEFILMEYIPNTIDLVEGHLFFQNQSNVTELFFRLNNLLETVKNMAILGMFHMDFASRHNLLITTTNDHICYVIDFGQLFFMTSKNIRYKYHILSDAAYGFHTPWAHYLNDKNVRLNILTKDNDYLL